MHASKTVDASKTIEQISSETIAQNASKSNKAGTEKQFITYIDTYLKNLLTPLLTTLFGINTDNQISILSTYQLSDTNLTRMEHLLLSATNIGLKDITIFSEWLGNKLIAHSSQASTYIDRWVHGDRDFPFGSWKSGNKMTVDFGWKCG